MTFIILDEAQNTTKEQMKMFLTRMGNHSRVVVNGDVTQIDLVDRKMSGLIEAQKVLQNVRGLGMVYFTDEDVVRHDMVGRIIRAYEDFYQKRIERWTSMNININYEDPSFQNDTYEQVIEQVCQEAALVYGLGRMRKSASSCATTNTSTS